MSEQVFVQVEMLDDRNQTIAIIQQPVREGQLFYQFDLPKGAASISVSTNVIRINDEAAKRRDRKLGQQA